MGKGSWLFRVGILMMRWRTVSVALVIVSLAACVQAAEPTPTSDLISVDPERPTTRITQTSTTSFFDMPIHFRNTSGRPIYIDASYRGIEKLIDQKWRVAVENNPSPFSSTAFLLPGRETRFSVTVFFNPKNAGSTPLLEDMRGLYRVRFRVAFDSRGADPLPSDAGLSQPFAVTR